MKFFLALVFLFLSSASYAQESDSDRADDRSSGRSASSDQSKLLFKHGRITLGVPSDLRSFTPEDFDKQYGKVTEGSAARPEYAYLHDVTDARVVINVTESDLPKDSLLSYKLKLERSLEKVVKDLMWHKREMLTFGGVEWVHLEMQNIAEDGKKVMNDFYATSFAGHPLLFTLTTDSKHFYDLRKKMQKMMLSVRLEERRDRATK